MDLDPISFLVLFPLLWCGVSFLLAYLGGWARLAARFRAVDAPSGKRLVMQPGQIGMVRYSSCLTLHLAEDGLYMAVFPLWRIGHPCLFIPWNEFHNLRRTKSLFVDFVKASIGSPPITTVVLRPRVFPPEFLASELERVAQTSDF